MIEIEKPRIEAVEIAPDGTYGKFVVEPLKEALAPHWATVCAVFCCHPFPA